MKHAINQRDVQRMHIVQQTPQRKRKRMRWNRESTHCSAENYELFSLYARKYSIQLETTSRQQ